jgi:hypothetical protein
VSDGRRKKRGGETNFDRIIIVERHFPIHRSDHTHMYMYTHLNKSSGGSFASLRGRAMIWGAKNVGSQRMSKSLPGFSGQ